ncbi:uncharacterized protein si:ch211-221j21.3 [Silurus meridionalis]|uniref:uncharacterized protein si:ch211-221j21.3 n=1 Tax=Silurus meridionalis TaxID=175797 RepID=UPI001EEB7084|nr:uncharacterized protein si:ch211-221j21.3 [Silurus meridionalis]XP_046708897.1 uncharacterized protein si:ch211-221j21.3 [Silurus meridionalis]XP_046708898.1 uncharacterized protein si:ch211-221j21.3 [Silurus meridionalis]
MSMDCVRTLVQNKRQREEEQHCQWDSQAKKACTGLESCIEVRCDVVMDSPMDSWDTHQNGANANAHLTRMGFVAAQQPCPRCMAGEPGHINHIMQGY